MSAQKHPVFAASTPSVDTRIWRYVDFTKFVDMLERRSLFFAAASRLKDPFEGSLARYNDFRRRTRFAGTPYADLSDQMIRQEERLGAFMRDHTFVNCWHMNQGESAAMWKLYARTEEAVALRSTYGALRACLPEEGDDVIYIGKVEYIDYDREAMPETNSLWPYLHKRRSFAHECELRALRFTTPMKLSNDPDPISSVDYDAPTRAGIAFPIELNKLIERVVVAPTSPSWFVELVARMLDRYGLTCGAERTALDSSPIY